jgi:hypothetical protein
LPIYGEFVNDMVLTSKSVTPIISSFTFWSTE